jgi:DNA repair protein RecN (Recombination protein N)
MLNELKIQNYALIRDLEIRFGEGLSAITGETGTGKSIMLGALGLILGNRADTSSLFDTERKCVVEGRFSIGAYDLKTFFERNDLDWEENTILRREISPNGKSRAFINDTPVNLNILKELGENLVDIHSQHQTIRLLSPAFQIGLLDAFAGHKSLLEEYGRTFGQYRTLGKELSRMKEKNAQAQKEYDYNLFQLNEISQAGLQPHEREQAEEELLVLSNAENIQQNLQQAIFGLYEDERSIYQALSSLKKQLGSIAKLNPRLEQIHSRLEQMLIECRDISRDMDDFSSSVSVDNERMEILNRRLQLINNLLQKHQYRKVEELLDYAEELQTKVNSVESLSGAIEETEKRKQAMEQSLHAQAGHIHANREKQIRPLEENLVRLLKQVGIPDAFISIRLSALENLSETGKDEIEILFSANKGSKAGPVSQVASGGELSRLMLCFKYILADSIFLPTIIFDEIDTGVSGEVAIQVGQILKKLSVRHQVVCITHQPQVAAMGNRHYMVYKISGQDFTSTHIRQLQSEERIQEIAKMIAGQRPSQLAIDNAKELLAVNA